MHVDEIDRKILAELQEDGRLTVTELADRVQLTAAPCHRRLRELERTGVITGYRAVLDPAAVGLGFEALVSVTLDRGDAATVAAFETALAGVPQIRHAERLFGDPDYLLRVAATDLDDYAALRDHELATLPGVKRITSTLVMERIVDKRPPPRAGREPGRPDRPWRPVPCRHDVKACRLSPNSRDLSRRPPTVLVHDRGQVRFIIGRNCPRSWSTSGTRGPGSGERWW